MSILNEMLEIYLENYKRKVGYFYYGDQNPFIRGIKSIPEEFDQFKPLEILDHGKYS